MGGVFYIIIFLLVFGINLFAVSQKNKKAKYALIALGFVILLLMLGLRYNVGTDYPRYLSRYTLAKDFTFEEIMTKYKDPFVTLVYSIFSKITNGGYFVFFLYGALSLVPIYLASKVKDFKNLPYLVLAFCFICLPFSMNGMRQGVALSFTVLAVTLLTNKKIKSGIASYIIACLFHFPALVLLPYLATYGICKKLKKSTLWPNIIITAVISIVVLFFLGNILSMLGLGAYKYIANKISISDISFISILPYIPILLAPIVLNKKRVRELPENINFYNQLVYSGFVLFIIGTAAQYLGRLSLYFIIFSILTIPTLIDHIENEKFRKIVRILFVLYLIAFFVFQFVIMGRHEIIPYQTYLFGV